VRVGLLAVAAVLLAACTSAPTTSSGEDAQATVGTTARTTSASVTTAPGTIAPGTIAPGTVAPGTVASTTATTGSPNPTPAVIASTSEPPQPPATSTTTTAPQLEERVIGASVEGRPIVARRSGSPGGTVVVVVGVIHGDEVAGLAVVNRLRGAAVPAGIDLWLIDSVNPDGVVNSTRGNAHLVDLNRNFPFDWRAMGGPGDPQYAGTGPASEPETQAVVAFLSEIRPALTMWYHQDLFRVNPGTGKDGQIRRRYAELTGLPLDAITGGRYTGVAATWVKRSIPGAVSFVIELGPTLSPQDADVHAAAVLDVALLA
jgi:protein MpaA